MKFPGPTLCIVAVVAWLGMTEARTDDAGSVSTRAADPMRGKDPGDVRDDNGLKMKLVWCPPGAFTMESVEVVTERAATDEPRDEDLARKDVRQRKVQKTTIIRPVKVALMKGYWLGKYEVTQSEWKEVMGTEPWKGQEFTKEGADYPATFVSWNDAIHFCRKLTERERQAGRLSNGWEYTIPTEAQWERACRARTTTIFSFGDDDSGKWTRTKRTPTGSGRRNRIPGAFAICMATSGNGAATLIPQGCLADAIRKSNRTRKPETLRECIGAGAGTASAPAAGAHIATGRSPATASATSAFVSRSVPCGESVGVSPES
jgi:hypothetical protein